MDYVTSNLYARDYLHLLLSNSADNGTSCGARPGASTTIHECANSGTDGSTADGSSGAPGISRCYDNQHKERCDQNAGNNNPVMHVRHLPNHFYTSPIRRSFLCMNFISSP